MSLVLMDILGILIIYQSFVFIFSMLIDKGTKPLFSKILVFICLTIIFHFGYMLMQQHGIQDQLQLGPFFGLLYGPLYYAYTRSLILETSGLKKLAPHFIPAFFILVLLIARGSLLREMIDLIGLLISLHVVAYLIRALKLIYDYRKRLRNTLSSFHRISLYWLEAIIYLQLATLMVALLESYFQTVMNTDVFILVIYGFTLILIHCFYYLGLKQVRLFKGFREEREEDTNLKEYTLPEDVFADYAAKLQAYMEHEKPYLDFDITIQELSEKLGVSTRNLSHVINRHYNRNYYGFINNFRLEAAKKGLSSSNASIKEIMYDSGFSNKATFHALFKKATGLTPAQYRNSRKN